MLRKIIVLCLSLFTWFTGYAQISYGDYRVLIDVTGNGFSHNSQIYFDDESWDPSYAPTYGWDGDVCCDANLLGVSVGHVRPFVFTEVVEPPAPSVNHMLSVNGLPHLFEQTDVPLGFLPGTLAQYTFSFSDLYTLPAGVTVELIDIPQNVTQDLLVDSTYVTWGAPSDPEARFIVRFNPSNVTGVNTSLDEEVSLFIQDGRLILQGLSESKERINVSCYNMLGAEVLKESLSQISGKAYLEISNLTSGVYVLSVSDKNGIRTYRKFYYQ